jgi:hypothetical protein
MIKAADFRQRDDLALLWWLNPPGFGSVFVQT